MQTPNYSGRPTRSRYSSPFVTAVNNAGAEAAGTMADAAERPKTFMDKWIEPALPPPRASFEEAGFERVGTVSNMAPLGTRPSWKILKAATRGEVREGLGRAKRSEASTPEASEAPSQMVTRRSLSAKLEDVELSPRTPQQQTSPRNISHKPNNSQSSGQGVFAIAQSPLSMAPTMTAPVVPLATPSPLLPAFSSQVPLALDPDGEPAVDLEKTDKVVEDAVQHAVDLRRYPTAYALRMLYDEQHSDIRIVRIFEAIYNRRATAAQVEEFLKMMKEKKKEGKKDRTAEYYFNGDGSDPPPRPVFSAVNTALTYDTPPGRLGTSGRSLSDSHARASSLHLSSLSASPHKDLDYGHISKKQKQNHFVSPYPPLNGMGFPAPSISATNGNMNAKPDAPLANGTSAAPSQEKGDRSRSLSSSSSLSSLDEQILKSGQATASGTRRGSMLSESASHHGNEAGRGRGKRRGGRSSRAGEGLASDQHDNSINNIPNNTNDNSNSRNSTPAEPFINNTTQPQSMRSAAAPPKPRTGPKTYTFSTITATSTSTSSPTPTSIQIPSSVQQKSLLDISPPSPSPSPSPRTSTGMARGRRAKKTTAKSKAASPVEVEPAAIQPSAEEDVDSEQAARTLQNETHTRMKRKARETAKNRPVPEESFERTQVTLPSQDVETASEGGDFVAVAQSKRPTKKRMLNLRETRSKDNNNEGSESLSSPNALSFQLEFKPGTPAPSRAGTPSATNRPTRKAKAGSGLRVKTSPVKKKGGIVAGIPRASGERNSPVGNGVSAENKDDNDDYCSACGGNGDLVCCDGCCRSFHFRCVDPPMVEGALPDAWFCNSCEFTHNPRPVKPFNGGFGALLSNLEKKNPIAFHLPKDVRERFEGVKTGTEGEYEDERRPNKPKTRGGYDEPQDGFRQKDNKGKAVLCHSCNGAAVLPARMIISCSFCSLHWHLDCLDPPMSKEPSAERKWRCPAHVDDLMDLLPAKLGPAHRYRKIKGAPAITPSFARGTRNNGHIEIENTPTDDEDDGFYESKQFGSVYKLPEMGLKLDFISKIKQQGGGFPPTPILQRMKSPPNETTWAPRTVSEQQAALNLASLAAQNTEVGDVGLLSTALLAEASPSVIDMIAQADATSLSKKKLSKRDRTGLAALKAIIEQTLASSNSDDDDEHDAEEGVVAKDTVD